MITQYRMSDYADAEGPSAIKAVDVNLLDKVLVIADTERNHELRHATGSRVRRLRPRDGGVTRRAVKNGGPARLPPPADRYERSWEDPGSLLGGVETAKRCCPALNVGIAGKPLSDHFSSRRPRGRPHPWWHAEDWSPAREALDAEANIAKQVTEAHAYRKVVAPGPMERQIALRQILQVGFGRREAQCRGVNVCKVEATAGGEQ